MRQPIVSSFEYGTNTPGLDQRKRLAEDVRPSSNSNKIDLMQKVHPQFSKPQQKNEGYFQLGSNPVKYLEKSINQNESSFLDKVVNEFDYSGNYAQNIATQPWGNKIYYKSKNQQSSNIDQKNYQPMTMTQTPSNLAMNNNIHINMKFSQGANGSIIPSRIVLKPNLSTQFVRKVRNSQRNGEGGS